MGFLYALEIKSHAYGWTMGSQLKEAKDIDIDKDIEGMFVRNLCCARKSIGMLNVLASLLHTLSLE